MELSDPAFNQAKLISLYANVCQVATGLLPQLLSYQDMRRVLLVNDEEISAKGEDFLGIVLSQRLREVCKTKGDMLDINASLAALAEVGVARSYEGRCLLIWDLRDKCTVCGVLVACRFIPDETTSTAKFTEDYILEKKLPSDLNQYMLLDVVCSKRPPAGIIGVLTMFKIASRTRRNKLVGCAAVCINQESLKLFTSLGFHSHPFREKSVQRTLVYLRVDELKMEVIANRLKFEGSEDILTKICYRKGLSARNRDRAVMRCTTN